MVVTNKDQTSNDLIYPANSEVSKQLDEMVDQAVNGQNCTVFVSDQAAAS